MTTRSLLAVLLGLIGSLPVTAGAIVLVAGGLLALRERVEALALLGGMALTAVAVAIFDGVVQRDAPSAAADAAGYPDGGAAHAVAWVAVAIALRRAGPFAATAGIVAIGIALTVAVALSTVYLREEWFSDVAGGAGLGALCFSLAGAAALLIRVR